MAKSFIEQLKRCGEISFAAMRNVAVDDLKRNYTQPERDVLYGELKRGKDVLDDEAHLNQYLWSFGPMHMAKMELASQFIPKMFNPQDEDIEIFDWGCGQGTATICLLDYLYKSDLRNRIKSITLIDPSSAALKRASEVLKNMVPKKVSIRTVCKGFDDLLDEDFNNGSYNKLHLFSNILDVASFELAEFIQLIQRNLSGTNYFVCVGPYYYNNHRVDEFIEAIAPDAEFVNQRKHTGEWIKDWTLSLRIFKKSTFDVEEIAVIRRRIDDAKKNRQFFAGYILDEVSEAFDAMPNTADKERVKALLRSLSSFDVHSNIPIEAPETIDSKLAVLNNLIVRGLPTIAPIEIQNVFAEAFGTSTPTDEECPVIKYNSNGEIDANELYQALHIIDPRFQSDNYNGDLLESEFEKTFINKRLKGSENEYLIQLFEPQRRLSSMVSVPDNRFSQDQRVDFALELPVGTSEDSNIGFIVEIDSAAYHSNMFRKLHDQKRDRVTAASGWDTYRLDEVSNYTFVDDWSAEQGHVAYLNQIKRNYNRRIEGDWAKNLQLVLSPLAVTRLQKVIIETILSGALDCGKKLWRIAVVERDVPCAKMAIDNLQSAYNHLCALEGTEPLWPEIELDVFSTPEFISSPLLQDSSPKSELKSNGKYDVCIDVSMLLRDNIDAMPLPIEANAWFIIRSSHYRKEERQIYTSDSISYLPLVNKTDQGTYEDIEERKQILEYFLQNIFRKRSFRQGQLPILSRALSNRTTIGLLPTGGGKSLTYQMSSILQPGVTVVVDPLISLMVDQERGLRGIGIDTVACVNSTMSAVQKDKHLSMLQNGCLQFVLMSPERFMMENFRESVEVMSIKNNVYFAYGVIDEVHCVSEWGHDFRPAYLHLGRNMIEFMHTKSGQKVPIIGLTATASFDVLADVERELTLGGNLTLDSDAIVRPENDTRDELTYKVVEVVANFDDMMDPNEEYLLGVKSDYPLKERVAECKKKKIEELLSVIPYDIRRLNRDKPKKLRTGDFDDVSFFRPNSAGKYDFAGIIFCPHKRGTSGVNDRKFKDTSTPGISSYVIANCSDRVKTGTFVGGDKPSGDMQLFNANDQNLMIATKAFGMGIDKPNVRYTINFTHPSSIESFVQEAGRGGRDRKNAIAYMLYEQTEYICLSVDKLNTIALDMGEQTIRLWNLRNKYVLATDLKDLCVRYGYTPEEADKVYEICVNREYFENVDKDIELYLHNKSFRGLFKEKVILYEMTDRILNVKPRRILEVQNRLREAMDNTDIELKLLVAKNSIVIQSADDPTLQYGYLFLENLFPTFPFINFDEYSVCRPIVNTLIGILSEYKDHSAAWLNKPVSGSEESHNGIYAAMEGVTQDGYTYVTVSWENQAKQDETEFENIVKGEITKIAQTNQWNNIGPLNLRKIGSFDELIEKIALLSDDPRWMIHKSAENVFLGLKKAFCTKRDKDDTDKAIYRMCCVGLVEDVTIDYNLQTYQLKIRKRTDDEYLQCMYDFFRKYYSREQSKIKVEEIKKHEGRNILDKCLGYLAEFVYENLEKKRYRSIDDIRMACSNGLVEGEDWLKEFIHLYFNSKYARDDYRIGEEEYSLKQDTDRNREDFGVVRKYIEAIDKDPSGSEIDNVKHLYGATLLVLRAHPENAALNLLRTFCIIFLGVGKNQTLRQDALKGYIDGFVRLGKEERMTIPSLVELMDGFNLTLKKYSHNADKAAKNIEEWKDIVIANFYGSWVEKFSDSYTK